MAEKTKRTHQQIGKASKAKGARFELEIAHYFRDNGYPEACRTHSMLVRTMVRLMLREFPDYGLNVNIRKRCSFIHG